VSEQSDLFGPLRVVQTQSRGYEVHEHAFVSGPRSRYFGESSRVVHSHEGGDKPHEHPDTGPACFTIDKDDWARATAGIAGLAAVGGSRKRFTNKPDGEQLPYIERAPMTIEVIVCEPPAEFNGIGGGEFALARMQLAFKANARFQVIDGGPKQATGED
jgi:hypothetical protein